MNLFANLKTAGRVAVLAIALSGVALTAVPAQAAPLDAFKLELAAPQVDIGAQTQMKTFVYDEDEEYDDYDWCLTNKQIRKGLKKADFDDIEFVQELKKHRVRVHALYEDDDWYYSMRIDRCTGEVDKIKRLYPAYDEDDFDIEF